MPDHTPLAALESALSRYEAIPPAPEDAPSYIKAQTEAKRTRALLEFTAHCTPEMVRGLLDGTSERAMLTRQLADSLVECVDYVDEAIDAYVAAYGEGYRPLRLRAMREEAARARAAIDAARKEQAQ